eukprot:5816243-Amphidinium_carterae.3
MMYIAPLAGSNTMTTVPVAHVAQDVGEAAQWIKELKVGVAPWAASGWWSRKATPALGLLGRSWWYGRVVVVEVDDVVSEDVEINSNSHHHFQSPRDQMEGLGCEAAAPPQVAPRPRRHLPEVVVSAEHACPAELLSCDVSVSRANGEDHHGVGLEVDDLDVPAAMRCPPEGEKIHSAAHVGSQSCKSVQGDPALIPVAKAEGETGGWASANVRDHKEAIVQVNCRASTKVRCGSVRMAGARSRKASESWSSSSWSSSCASVTSSGSNMPPLSCSAGVGAGKAESGAACWWEPGWSADLAISWSVRWRCLVRLLGLARRR